MPGIDISQEVYDYIKKLIEHPVVRVRKSILTSPSRFVREAVSEYILKIESLINENHNNID